MRVSALAHQYVPVRNAGAETMLHSMLRALVARGHSVDVVLSAQRGEPYDVDGVRVWPYTGDKTRDTPLRFAPDLLVSHLENSQRAAYLGGWNDVPVAIINHNTFEPSKALSQLPYARVDVIAVNSQWMADDLAAWHRTVRHPQPRTVIVRPLVDPAEYAAFDGPHDRVTLVNLRPMEKSHADSALMGKGAEVFWWLAERSPKLRFLGVKGAYGGQLVKDLSNVDVLEHVAPDQMRDQVYARTRVLLMPSSYESWGRVATEAMHSGIPVIAHPTPGLVENLGQAGIFVDREDVDGWRRALQTLALPGPYAAASRRALARAAELDPADDLARWCDAVEQAAERGRIRG